MRRLTVPVPCQILLIVGTMIVGLSSGALAQSRGAGSKGIPPHKLELVGYGGYRWTVSEDITYVLRPATWDIENSGFYGFALDVNARPGMQVRLSYERQDSKTQIKQGGFVAEEYDTAVEYWHVGAVQGMPKGNVMPYGLVSLGGTRFAADRGDNWKFSIMLGLGAKLYLSEKVGLLVQGRMPFTFLSGGLGVGTGGATVYGTGIVQFDVGAGLMILI